MKRLLRIAALFSVTLLWWGEKGYAATPATDAANKETISAAIEAEADKKDPKSDKKSDEPKRKRNLGHLSGSFETNTIYYVEDSKTGAVVPHNSYGSNNFLKLDYQLGRFSAGVQLEYYPHPLVGTPMQGYEYVMEGFSINNLTEKYISWTDRNYSVTVGDFYEQFGSGLILRAWEDRALGFNNSLGGARVTFNIKDIVEGKVLYAFPRFNLGYLSTQIAGGDLSFSLSNAIGLVDHQLSLEGSIVNRHFKNLPSWYTNYRDDYDFDLSKNVISYSGRVNYEYRGLSAKFEYVGKSKDVYLDNMTGEPVENAAWTTTEIGEYKFQAVYDSYTSDPVTVSAIDKNKDKEFYRYVLLLKFTYMTCGNCVTAQDYFNALDKEDRDHFLVVAAHQPTGAPVDPYGCPVGVALNNKYGVTMYPTWSYNFEDLVVGIGAGAITKTSIRQQINHAETTYPAVCGVKATSKLEGSTAKIEATVQFQQAGNYKIACVLVENNNSTNI